MEEEGPLSVSLVHSQGPPSLSELLPATVQARTELVLRSSHSFRFAFASSSRHLSSFLCFSIRLWNTLPASAISQSSSVSSFRFFLHSFYKADKFSLGLYLSVLNWCILLSFFLSVLTFPPSVFARVFFFSFFFLLVFLSFLLSFFSCTMEESPLISPLLLDNPLKIYHNNNKFFTFNNKKYTKRKKQKCTRAADSNHKPLDPKSFNFQLNHEKLVDVRWSKSLFIFQLIMSVHVAHQVKVRTLRKTRDFDPHHCSVRMPEISILFPSASSVSAIIFPSKY